MEEADLLADEVAVMKEGELAAFGSPLELKKAYGSALQFSLLVDTSRTSEIEGFIREFFEGRQASIIVESSKAGTIVVKIAALKDTEDAEGIELKSLTDFVHWLDSEASAVSEYSFSNSSLEEVFLRVTKDHAREDDEYQERLQDEDASVNVDDEPFHLDAGSTFDHLSRFKADLAWWNQAIVIWKFLLTSGWTGRGSIRNYLVYISVVTAMALVFESDPMLDVFVVIFLISIMLVFIISPLYADRSGGQLYTMKSHGLLPAGYIVGFSLYAFTVQLIHNILTLTLVFASPHFRGHAHFGSHDEK